jgi:hypothetical protein
MLIKKRESLMPSEIPPQRSSTPVKECSSRTEERIKAYHCQQPSTHGAKEKQEQMKETVSVIMPAVELEAMEMRMNRCEFSVQYQF